MSRLTGRALPLAARLLPEDRRCRQLVKSESPTRVIDPQVFQKPTIVIHDGGEIAIGFGKASFLGTKACELTLPISLA